MHGLRAAGASRAGDTLPEDLGQESTTPGAVEAAAGTQAMMGKDGVGVPCKGRRGLCSALRPSRYSGVGGLGQE